MNQLSIKKTNKVSKKKKKGFTLVELIIVIAVIAILAAIAIPKFGAVKKDANLSSDQANAKIIATAVATAVSNGDANPDTSSVYVKYIDGQRLPKAKSTGATGFTVTYSDATGVTVTLTGVGTQVYPTSTSVS